jgi:uncharacterized protein YdhG (YjbR/CyaY superfamily)
MDKSKTIPATVNDYIAASESHVKKHLKQIREAIRSAAPNAEEVISYQMPGYKQKGMLVFFAGYKNHIGFYPTASGIKNFENEIAKYKWSRGAVQFPLDKPLPLALIKKIVKFKLKENEEKAGLKKSIKNGKG